jgi:four helix bundle protein
LRIADCGLRIENQRAREEGEMVGSPQEFKRRAQQFALRVIRLIERLPKRTSGEVIGKQLLRCATSVGANYRAACRARSPSEFCAKMGIVEEEADECFSGWSY